MKTSFLNIVLAVLFFTACTKENAKISPGTFDIIQFDAIPESNEIKVGEQAVFHFEGNADSIYFYSGEFGKDYAFREGRVVPVENTSIDIHVRASYGHQRSLSILLSHDYNGEGSYEDIMNANWIDMTEKFNLPTPNGGSGNNATIYASGSIDISEFIEEGKPYYIAIRNDLKPNANGINTTQWDFYAVSNSRPGGFAIKGQTNGSPVTIAGLVDAEFKIIVNGWLGDELDGTRGPRLSPNNSDAPTSIFFARNSPSSSAMDTWAVTKLFASTANISGDKGTLIKRISELPLQEYKYFYETPGEYEVVFETINHDRTRHLVRRQITVIP